MAACTLTQTAFFFSLSSTKIILTGFFVCFCGVFFVSLFNGKTGAGKQTLLLLSQPSGSRTCCLESWSYKRLDGEATGSH